MKKEKQEKTYHEPCCAVSQIKTCSVLCESISNSGTIEDPFISATEILW